MKENQVDKQEVLCQANCVIDEWIKGNELERYSLERLTGCTLLELLLNSTTLVRKQPQTKQEQLDMALCQENFIYGHWKLNFV